jgi:hypothetical protein
LPVTAAGLREVVAASGLALISDSWDSDGKSGTRFPD